MSFSSKEEYYDYVRSVALDFLTTCDARTWKEENPEGEFHEFMDDVEDDGQFSSAIDSVTPAEWKDAVTILLHTDQNTDHVDSGLYEGCNWEKILVVIAYEVLSWDVRECAEELFDTDFPEVFIEYQDTRCQKGYHPGHKTFTIPDDDNMVDLGSSGVKVLLGYTSQKFREAVVFEGNSEKTEMGDYLVHARRVYLQTERKDRKIDDALEEVLNYHGVREL